MRIFPTIVCLICLVSLGLPGIAAAGPAVLHAPGLTADQAAAAARQALGSDDFTVVGSVDDRIGAIGDTVVVAGATTRECAQPSATSIAATLAAARMQLDEMEYEAGIDLLVRAAVNLPCGAEGATRGQLYELFFLRGLSAFNNEDVDGAKKAFAAAAVIDTGRPWDDSYPPTAKPLFLEALQDAVAPANVREIRSTVAGAYLDGAALATGARLAVGGHIVVAGGKALWLDVPAGTSPLLVTTASALSADVLAGGADGALWLAGLSADNGWADVLVVGDGTARRFRGTGFVGGDLLARSGPDPVLIAGLGTTGAGVVLLAIGGGLRGAAGAAATEAGLVPKDDGGWTVSSSTDPATFQEDYPAIKRQGDGGVALVVIGGAVTAAGVAVTVISLVGGKKQGVAVVPWLSPTNAGAAFGVVGRF